MFRYLIRRLLWAVVLFIAVTMVSYIIFFLVPAEPARLVAGPQAPPDAVERARKFLHLDEPICKQYLRFLHALSPSHLRGREARGEDALARPLVRDAPGRSTTIVKARRARHRLARLRRRHPLDADRPPDRDPLGAAAAIAVRQGRDDLRPDRDLGAPGLDRADPVVLLRLQARADADLGGYCDLVNPSTGLRRPRAVGART